MKNERDIYTDRTSLPRNYNMSATSIKPLNPCLTIYSISTTAAILSKFPTPFDNYDAKFNLTEPLNHPVQTYIVFTKLRYGQYHGHPVCTSS